MSSEFAGPARRFKVRGSQDAALSSPLSVPVLSYGYQFRTQAAGWAQDDRPPEGGPENLGLRAESREPKTAPPFSLPVSKNTGFA